MRDFFPPGTFDADISVNRLNKEAEVMALVRGLTGAQLDVALAQVKALSWLE